MSHIDGLDLPIGQIGSEEGLVVLLQDTNGQSTDDMFRGKHLSKIFLTFCDINIDWQVTIGVWVKQRPYSPLVSTTEMAIFGKLSWPNLTFLTPHLA